MMDFVDRSGYATGRSAPSARPAHGARPRSGPGGPPWCRGGLTATFRRKTSAHGTVFRSLGTPDSVWGRAFWAWGQLQTLGCVFWMREICCIATIYHPRFSGFCPYKGPGWRSFSNFSHLVRGIGWDWEGRAGKAGCSLFGASLPTPPLPRREVSRRPATGFATSRPRAWQDMEFVSGAPRARFGGF